VEVAEGRCLDLCTVGLYSGIGVEELKKTIRNLSDGQISGLRCNFPDYRKRNDTAKTKGIFVFFQIK
jgi:hypothetical protein